MKILLILDFCGEDENELYEVSSPSAERISKLDGQYVNCTDCSQEMDDWFSSLYDVDGERQPLGDDFKRLDKTQCGPFDAIVICGMLP